MAALKIAESPGETVENGDNVLDGVNDADAAPISQRISAFKRTHEQYAAAEMAVRAASRALQHQRRIVATAHAELNMAIAALAIALFNDGFARNQPFHSFGAPAPAVLQKLSFIEGAQETLALVKAIMLHSGISAKTVLAARFAGDAARKLITMLEPLVGREKARAEAIAKRSSRAPMDEKRFPA